jgi:ferredoxin-nitrate reductase
MSRAPSSPTTSTRLCSRPANRLPLPHAHEDGPRGELRAPARITGIREGVVFVPFHYGYWDHAGPHTRAANELTAIAWDPVSKQPLYKVAAVRVAKAG